MKNYKNSVKLTLVLTYVFMVLLAALVIALPFLVQSYVEYRGKSPKLATTIMIVFYTCVPFASVALFSIKKLLLNILSGLVLGDANVKLIKIVSLCLFFAAVFMIVMGHSYAPFYIAGISAGSCGLVCFTIKNVFNAALQTQRDFEFKSVREFYEKDDNFGNR